MWICVFLANCWTYLRGVGHSWFIRWGAQESRLSSRCHHGMSRVHNGNEAILKIIILSQWKCQLFLGEIFSSPKVDGVEVCRKNCLSKFCCGVYDPSWKSVQSIRWQSSIGPNGSNRIYPAFSALAIFLFYQYSSIFWQWKCFPSRSSSSFYPTCSLSPLSFGLCSAAFIDAFSKVVKCQKFQK